VHQKKTLILAKKSLGLRGPDPDRDWQTEREAGGRSDNRVRARPAKKSWHLDQRRGLVAVLNYADEKSAVKYYLTSLRGRGDVPRITARKKLVVRRVWQVARLSLVVSSTNYKV